MGRKINKEEFDYLGFLDHIETTPHAESHSANSSQKKEKEGGWSGARSYKEALDYAIKGWDSGIKKLDSEEKMLVDGIPKIENNVFGAYVSMGRYVSGLPDCMTNFKDEVDRNKDDLTLFVSLCYSAFNDVETALAYGQKLIHAINVKQIHYNVRLIGVFGVQESSQDILSFLEIKKLDERFVMNSIAFSCHPAFFRRLYFKSLEKLEYLDTFGYGSPFKKSQLEREIKKSDYYRTGDLFLPTLQDDKLNWELEDAIVL